METDYSQEQRGDVRHLVTTYQEDFEGLNSALCPGKIAEKYGPTYLEPRYRYTESEGKHDLFRYNKAISLPRIDCPHL